MELSGAALSAGGGSWGRGGQRERARMDSGGAGKGGVGSGMVLTPHSTVFQWPRCGFHLNVSLDGRLGNDVAPTHGGLLPGRKKKKKKNRIKSEHL